jgi:hypothetical protein
MSAAWKEVIDRRLVGGLLANCAFNLSQSDAISKRDREILADLRRQWDAIEAAPAKRIKRKTRTR